MKNENRVDSPKTERFLNGKEHRGGRSRHFKNSAIVLS